MTAQKFSPRAYDREYDYRQGFAFEQPLPEYLSELVEATDAGLCKDDTFSAVADIDLGVGRPKYRLVMDLRGMVLTTRVNGEEEDTYRPAAMFSAMGGIRDILAGLVSAGGLPERVDPDQVHIELQ